MARIRTIKPEFFTSADVVALSPLARLLYIATWCEADREGRLAWNLTTLKLRYLPADDCRIDELASELIERGLVVVYEVDGKAYAAIPSFAEHQHINPREAASRLPPPPVTDASVTRQARVSDAQGGRERKGKDLDHTSSGDDVSARGFGPEDLVELWNAAAPPECPRVRGLSDKRRARARQRLREHPDPEFWRAAIEAMHERPFLRGRGRRGWRADFDWLLQPDSATRVLEGCYADEAPEAVPRTPEDDGYRYFGGEP